MKNNRHNHYFGLEELPQDLADPHRSVVKVNIINGTVVGVLLKSNEQVRHRDENVISGDFVRWHYGETRRAVPNSTHAGQHECMIHEGEMSVMVERDGPMNGRSFGDSGFYARPPRHKRDLSAIAAMFLGERKLQVRSIADLIRK